MTGKKYNNMNRSDTIAKTVLSTFKVFIVIISFVNNSFSRFLILFPYNDTYRNISKELRGTFSVCCSFNYWFKTPCGEFATILIHNQHLDYWGVSQDELYDIAMANTPELLPYKFEDMMQIMMIMAREGNVPFSWYNKRQPMYILTNQYKINGAGCILYPELLKTFADMMGSDLCIIPSSIHETLLVPLMPNGKCHEMDWDEVVETVKEVNDTQLLPEEILSDHIYKYTRATGKITM